MRPAHVGIASNGGSQAAASWALERHAPPAQEQSEVFFERGGWEAPPAERVRLYMPLRLSPRLVELLRAVVHTRKKPVSK